MEFKKLKRKRGDEGFYPIQAESRSAKEVELGHAVSARLHYVAWLISRLAVPLA